MTHTDLKDVVREALGPSIDGTVVAAVSGGPDSMAMFHALCELSSEQPGLRIVVAYFDHQLRPDSLRDLEVIGPLAQRFGVRLIWDGADIRLRALESAQSIETTARVWRYTFLATIAEAFHARCIATAHTHDDQVETVMMRILRGAQQRGLRGIGARDGATVRPLLGVTHAETLRYCETHGIPYVTDPGNDDLTFFRNHVRHEVLPALRRVYPGIDEALLRVRDAAIRQYDDNERATAGRLDTWFRAGRDGWWLAHEAFEDLDDERRLHLLNCVVERLGIEDVTSVHYHAMLAGSAVDLPAWHVRREHDGLVFMLREGAARFAPQPLPLSGIARLAGWIFTSNVLDGAEAHEQLHGRPGGVAYLNVDGPLIVRCPRPGDRIQPLGMQGHKKLSDLFIDRKIPRRLRSRIPVVEANGEIVWVVGVAISERARVRGDENAVFRLGAVAEEQPA
ncbi:MAG TPA: tRNA lysidine(34) synthetase TilS [Candidatus Krumholzibacteria bacterium]|nr:tRNA lysidine(34) synthetase TilS [Candidatus Krumholzibacteria bacterium]